MCLIVDNNVVARVFAGADDPDFADLFKSLFGTSLPRVTVVYGGKLRREYVLNRKVVHALAALDRAGRAKAIPDSIVDAEEKVVTAENVCVSDDPHVIALARVSGVRVLCSHDQALHEDFTNPALLNSPRGKIYQNSTHRHLLVDACP